MIKQRLSNQLLHSQREFSTPAEVVSWLGAIQAQDYKGAKWSLGLRLPEYSEADIEEAIAERTFIRTWLLRGTLHFAAKEDVRWMLKLLTPGIIKGAASRDRQLDLNDKIFEKSKELFYRELMISKKLTREEMMIVLENAGISTSGQRGYHILWRVALEGLICFGPQLGNKQTFVLLDEWIPEPKALKKNQVLMVLASRYFSSHGPATVRDFAWWSGLKVTQAREGIEEASSKMVGEKIDGQIYWRLSDAEKPPEEAEMLLLPGFDEYFLGYKDRSAVIDTHHVGKIHPGHNGVFKPAILINGKAVGTWKADVKKNGVIITPQPFIQFSEPEERAFIKAAERYGDFLGMPVLSQTLSSQG